MKRKGVRSFSFGKTLFSRQAKPVEEKYRKAADDFYSNSPKPYWDREEKKEGAK